MSDVKYGFLFPGLTIYNYKSIEDNLSAMAAKGWKVENARPGLWKFKRTGLSNKKFFVHFASSVSELEPVSAEGQRTLKETCVEGGWKKEFQWKQMQVFSADQEVKPLEIDEIIRLENTHQKMKKTFIPDWTKVFFMMMILAFFNGRNLFINFSYVDEKKFLLFLGYLCGAFIAGATLLGYLFWFKLSKKKIIEGGTCVSTKWYHLFLIVLVIGFVAASIGILVYIITRN